MQQQAALFDPETVVIITGSSSGIGAATAVKFAQKGVKKFCLTGRNSEGLESTKKTVLGVCNDAEFVVVVGDITTSETCQQIVTDTINKFGRIDVLVNNAGMGAFSMKSFQNSAFYNMAKAALDMFTKTLAAEEGPKGIRVNCVNPGVVDTGIHVRSGIASELAAQLMQNHANPVRRTGDAEEVAAAIAFLASKEASFITGLLMVVDGGLNCHNPISW